MTCTAVLEWTDMGTSRVMNVGAVRCRKPPPNSLTIVVRMRSITWAEQSRLHPSIHPLTLLIEINRVRYN